jgi:1-acyl-sn-glycerol-3-phosphate acyltransferase
MRLIRVLLIVVVMCPLATAAGFAWLIPVRRWRHRTAYRIAQAWARFILWTLRIRVRLDPPDAAVSGPALCVANHQSYLDILVLMSVKPAAFISKRSVLWWPLIGQAAAAGGTLFVDRSKRLGVRDLVRMIRDRLDRGASVFFFPEATTSDGEGLLPFKGSLFAAAAGTDGRAHDIRPFVVRYLAIGGETIDASNRARVGWFGDATFAGHIWGILAAPGIDVVVRPLPARPLPEQRRGFVDELRQEMLDVYCSLEPESEPAPQNRD